MAETPQQRAERLNNGRGFSGRSYSVLNGEVVRRNNGLHLQGQTDWQDPISGKTVGPYKQPTQTKPTTQTGNPFGQNFAPFEMPDNAPLRAIPVIGQKTEAQRNAAPQNANPFAPNFQPFYIPDNAPVRQVIGPRPGSDRSNNASEINARLKQQAAEKAAALKQTKGDYDHSSGSFTRSEVAARQETRNIPGGGTQDGLKMSGGVSAAFVPEYANSSFNDLLAAQGNQRYGAFSSNQLPTTQSNPFSATAPKTNSFDTGAESYTGNVSSNFGGDGGAAAASSTDKSQFTPMSGKESRIEGASDRKAGGSLSDALADTAGINSYMDKFSSGDRQRAASRAFLDGTDSYDGLRKRDAVNGVVYAGGQHYIDGGEGNPAQRLEDPQNARDIASGKAKAQDFLQAKIDTTIDTQKQTPAEAQDPLSAAGSAVRSGFAAGAQTDFSLNNNQSAPQTGVGPVVPTDQIPTDLSGAAGKKYLADLDAGRLFK